MSSESGAPITSKENGISSAKVAMLLVVSRVKIGGIDPLGPRTSPSMRVLSVGICERPGVPTSDATVPSRD
jgi:hypothetical protein